MTSASTEYSQALPDGTVKFTVQCRAAYATKLCFTSEASGTTYITIPASGTYCEDGINTSGRTLYFQCGTAAQVMEIIAWTR